MRTLKFSELIILINDQIEKMNQIKIDGTKIYAVKGICQNILNYITKIDNLPKIED